jgi:Leucine-rich repeat (LRR) protein
MLAAMLVAAVLFAWFGWRLRKSRRQARAVAVLQELGAVYAYDFQGPIVRSTRPPWTLKPTPGTSIFPRWLHSRFGVDFLHNVTRVHLETTYRLANDDIERLWSALADLPDLTYLEASGHVTRPGAIQRLQHPQRLQRLAIRWGDMADVDLVVLARMPRLTELNLNETPVGDGALVHIGKVHGLQAIELHHTKISNSGLSEIAKLPQLRRLRLSATSIDDAGVRELRSLACLQDLDLVHTNISDRALDDIATLSSLNRLDLSMTNVTEQGLARLASLERLRELRLEAMPNLHDVLAVIPKLPALEELHGAILTGDLSRVAQCPRLRVLDAGFQIDDAMRGVKLPPTLEEISGLSLSDEAVEELTSLLQLKTVRTRDHFSMDIEEVEKARRLRAKLRAARPNVRLF